MAKLNKRDGGKRMGTQYISVISQGSTSKFFHCPVVKKIKTPVGPVQVVSKEIQPLPEPVRIPWYKKLFRRIFKKNS